MIFTTGEQRNYDILLGADGIASATRDVLFPGAPSQPTRVNGAFVGWFQAPSSNQKAGTRAPLARWVSILSLRVLRASSMFLRCSMSQRISVQRKKISMRCSVVCSIP